uniref:Transporter n=1 Tax=Sinonovacula rivularis TaxID=489091 RepID=A0AA49X8H9_9BIVA|nr:NTT10 [Sinonovacula rivularis]
MARQQWSKRIEFFLTAVGYAVGVGDLWRFPYLVMKNGGGAFLIAIIFFNIIGAIPIVYLEMIMGQYSQSGAITVWSVCPLMKGIGLGTIIVIFLYGVYYAVFISWMLFYFIHSFFPDPPWNTCDNDWNIPEKCITSSFHDVISQTDNVTTSPLTNATAMYTSLLATNVTNVDMETAAEQFLFYKTLKLSDGLHELGSINWPVAGCLLAIEVFCFFVIFKGINFSGKVVYFTVLGPFVMLIIFMIRGAILPGADIGIKLYLTPDLEKLKEPRIWVEACMQVIRSIGPGLGVMITFASHNKVTNNCLRDAVLVCLMDLTAGFLGGFVIFSVLGHVSYRTGIDIRSFNQSGLGLGFVAYPEAANFLPPSHLWCALFFFMSIFLGIDSEFPAYEVVVTSVKDQFPDFFKGRTIHLTFAVIFSAFLLALPQVTQGGMYVLTLVDWYVGTFSVTVFALVEVIVMVYVYGMKNLNDNVYSMTGKNIPIVFKLCWSFVSPVLLTVMLVFTVLTYRPPSYNNYHYPGWAVGLGWMIATCSLVPFPIYAIYKLYNTPGTLRERFRVNLQPTEDWGRRFKQLSAEIIVESPPEYLLTKM